MKTRPALKTYVLLTVALVRLASGVHAATAQQPSYTRADTLRGTITPERAWWDVLYYELDVRVSPADSTVRGSNQITYLVTAASRDLQLDLAAPLEVQRVEQAGRTLEYAREGNAFLVKIPAPQPVGSVHTVTVHYGGRPQIAKNPPWDGGFIWTTDPEGRPWVATAVQGIGASIWWPNKDHQADEPDSLRVRVTVPSSMMGISNGRMEEVRANGDGTTAYGWALRSPINNYGVTVNAGSYVNFADTLEGYDGILDLEHWVLQENLMKARTQFQQALPVLHCFEDWFGPYPFYDDSYKLVETPYLGMEHQSAVAYGNGYQNGYRGADISGTGLGLEWDYIIVHETAHEWWGNNITTEDIADMWVHEGFAAYAESLYVECLNGKRAGAEYVRGTRGQIQNDRTIIGDYGVNSEGSGDMYFKGANLLHTIRQVVNDDVRWRGILTGLNRTFRHQTVTSREVEEYVSREAGVDLGRVFEQYLRRTSLPVLEYAVSGPFLRYRWRAQVDGFDMPVRVQLAGGRTEWLSPETGAWKTLELPSEVETVRVDRDFYVQAEPEEAR